MPPNTNFTPELEVEWTKVLTVDEHKTFNYNGFKPGTTLLPKGHVKPSGRGGRPLPAAMHYDRDCAVKLRDGVTIYVDVFRPDTTEKLPAIIAWSPYGKSGTGSNYYHHAPWNANIPPLSGYDKFEGPDPAEWVTRGYISISPDPRGIGKSEGDAVFWGMQEAEDVYDVIDWIVKQPWSDGGVAMSGNSWLSQAQSNAAARLCHPALKCIAPWEGLTDIYRDRNMRGGMVWRTGFAKYILAGFAGDGLAEDLPAMTGKIPFANHPYWLSKIQPVWNINIPTYVVASYTTILHSAGSFRVFRQAATKDKWLRVHGTQEWHDYFVPYVVDDLQRFFDYFLKGIDNGWRSTPKVRLSLLGYQTTPTLFERPENEYPLARQKNRTYYLDANTMTASETKPEKEGSKDYEAHSLTESIHFIIKFDRYTELAGYPKIKLFLSCKEHDEMDAVVILQKVDKDGNLLRHVNYNRPTPVPKDEVPDLNPTIFVGPQAVLRFSHACTYNKEKSTVNEPYYDHDRSEPIPPGTVVGAEMGFWPIGMAFNAGEGLAVRISGHDMAAPELEPIRLKEPEDTNVGRHIVHTGGKYDTHVVLPFINY